jgi:serine/threonine-protein kinase
VTGASWERVKELFQLAIERGPDERHTFLEQVCSGDRALRQQVESLLAAHQEAGAFAERPALEMLAEAPPANVEYQILAPLGAGGMGEVFRARDVSLGRDVAIKILPPRFVESPERLSRFEREARMLASLNHPNICGIYGLTDINGAPALVLELIDGPTLAERLQQSNSGARRLGLKEALTIARDIGRALEAAHEKGIVHRDLKPANIKITPDGVVKVLDFGLAKANVESPRLADDAVGSAMPACESRDGVLLGTAAYMSPEQARGEPTDKRTDIWSFGCVLYEMIAGRRAVQGSTVSNTLAAIAESEPEWNEIPRSLSPNVERLLRRCLEKDAKRRLRDIGDAGFELDEAIASFDGTNTVVTDRRGARAARRAWAWSLAAAVALGASLALLWPREATRAPASELRRVNAEFGTDAALVTFQFGQGSAIILSPDGSTLAFVARARDGAARQIYLRRLNELRAVPLSGTDGALNPFFSPDGQWIAYFADGKLKKVPTAGGGAVTISAVPPNHRGGAWGENGMIAFSPDREHAPLWQVSSSGGEPVPLTSLGENEITQRWPQILPGGKAVLFTGNDRADGFQQANVVVQSLPTGQRKVLVRGGAYHGRYLASGHLVYMHNATLFAAPFDLDRLEITGPAVPVLEGATVNTPVGAAEIAFSDTGTMAYLPAPEKVNYDMIEAPIEWMDRRGTTKPLRAMSARWLYPRFAANGRQLAFSLFDGTQYDVSVYDWSRDELTRLTFDPAGDIYPVWTPDSRRIVFRSNRDNRAGNLYWQRVDNTGEVQRLTTAERGHTPGSWHPNGRVLAFSEVDPRTGETSIMMLRLDGDEPSGWRPADPVRFVKDAESPMFSPDGRWLAYTSKSSANVGTEVFVSPFPGPGGPWQVSISGGANPVWSSTKPELFYGAPDNRIMVTSYSAPGGSFRAEKPRVLSDTQFMPRPVGRSFDVHPDGDRFALEKAPAAGAKPNHVTLVFGFLDELRRIAR